MRLTVQHAGGLSFVATAGRHTVSVDAAPEDGGTGAALSAPQLFAAAVGACALEFVVNSCRLRGIPFERLHLDMAVEEGPRPRRIAALTATIRIWPEPPDTVKHRLASVARQAILVNTLRHPPEVDIRFADKVD